MNKSTKSVESRAVLYFKFHYNHFFSISFTFQELVWFCLFYGVRKTKLVSLSGLDCYVDYRAIDIQKLVLIYGLCSNFRPLGRACWVLQKAVLTK